MDEAVITATRTERKMGNLAVPVNIISKRIIEESGSLRLNEILQQQTGMVISSNSGSGGIGGGIFGNGVQLQGLSADYTMILVDGEPMIGRQGGVMDLSRFALGNIRKIEIVKGPSSSLYGSEAMGGVINLITEESNQNSLKAGIRYGSFSNLDLSLQGSYNFEKTSIYGYLDRNSSKGYDLNPGTPENTVDPYYNYTGQIRLKHHFSEKTHLLLNTRYDFGNQESFYAIGSKKINVGGKGVLNDLTVSPTVKHYFSPKLKTTLRLQSSFYSYTQKLDSLSDGTSYYNDYFRQNFFRAEDQTDFKITGNNLISFGGGYIYQTVNTNRYREEKSQNLFYAFLQDEWEIKENFNLIAGIRYDHSSDYESHLSPKIALHYRASPKLSFSASYGSGFKAPDFRQLYLDFINNAAMGYAIYGASEFSEEKLKQQEAAGLIDRVLPEAGQIKKLKPEVSHGFNAGSKFTNLKDFTADLNLFYNRINQLINYIPVAINANGTQVFSYINISRAMTTGGELNLGYQLNKNFQILGGYQYLYTADLDVLEDIKEGKVYGRDKESGGARKMKLNDYSGLLNRSRHMLTGKIMYANPDLGITGNIFASYRSKWGVTDLDGNGFANMESEFAKGYLQLNFTGSYRFNDHWKVQGGVNNLLNYTDANYLTNLPGRNYFLGIYYSL